MKIVLAQQNYHIGNFQSNLEKISAAIEKANEQKADLIVFSELSICGYPPADFLEFDEFITDCENAIQEICKQTRDIGVLIGAPTRNDIKKGKNLFNSALLLYQGEIKGRVNKSLLPTYDIFDEYRYFEPAYEWNLLEFKGKKLAVTICEDLWNLEDDPLYRICPMDELIKHAPDIMINLSASPFDYDHDDARKVIIRNNVLRYRLPMIYCNSVGAQTEIVFDGGSLVYNAEAELIQELKYFEEDQTTVYFNEDGTITSNDPSSEYSNTSPVADSAVPDTSVRLMNRKSGETSSDSITSATPDKLNPAADLLHFITARENMVQIRQAIVLGIKDYFRKMGFTKAILGSSGGIDSAVTLVLACEALGHTNVRAVLMPSSFSTNHSVSDAEQLSLNLQNPYDIIPIAGLFDAFSTSLKPVFGDLPFDVAEENLQSRIRGNLLMAVSNKFGNILLNTSNKSELATGYGTLYGDMAGGLSILGDLYKSQVYALAWLINEEKEIIPNHILIKPPSAELRPGQKDSDSLPDYDVLDQILFLHIEKRLGPSAITNAGFDEAIVKKTLRLVNNNEYKRKQFAPIIRVSSKAFGAGRRMPVVGKYLNFNR